MHKHTPGPWGVTENPEAHKAPIITGPNEYDLICAMYGGQWQVVEANASLIAAAPDLLEALQQIVNALDCGLKTEEGSINHKLAIAAITKALGEQK